MHGDNFELLAKTGLSSHQLNCERWLHIKPDPAIYQEGLVCGQLQIRLNNELFL
jgi:hypothetical protein